MTEEELIDGCARAIHGANTGWNVALGDVAPDPPFDALPEWHKDWIRHRVQLIIDGYGPEALHEDWVDEMKRRGWELGDIKNPTGNPPTHPCLKNWRQCPPEQQRKDTMAISIVKNLLGIAV
jgi:hypothetical protein